MDEYNAFEPLPGLHVNGKLTLGENIADLGGVSIAYEALQRALAKDPAKRKKIDGFTPEQRFFISFAQIWRSNIREAEQRRLITVDPHSPGQFRAIGPLVSAILLRRLRITSANQSATTGNKRAKSGKKVPTPGCYLSFDLVILGSSREFRERAPWFESSEPLR